MHTRGHRRASAVAFRAILIGAIAVLIPCAVCALPWSTGIATSPQIMLCYPSFLSAETAGALLADRQRALAFAEDVLGGQLFRRLIITIEPTLLTNAGHTEPIVDGGTIMFYLPVSALERFENDGTSPFRLAGCHEEVHALARHLWEDGLFGTLGPLGEGIAVYVEELRSGRALRYSIAAALQACGRLFDVERLLDAFGWGEADEDVSQLNLYYAGASLCEFLITDYGLARFAELYGVEWIEVDLRHPETEPIEAEPAVEIERIFGTSIGEIDAEWQAWITSRATISRPEAERFLQAFAALPAALGASVTELEQTWATAPYQLVGPSALAADLYADLIASMFDLSTLRGSVLEAAYASFCASTERLQELLAAWLEAIEALDTALELLRDGEVSDRIVELLRAAEVGYGAVEDTHMLGQVRDLLADREPAEAVTSPD